MTVISGKDTSITVTEFNRKYVKISRSQKNVKLRYTNYFLMKCDNIDNKGGYKIERTFITHKSLDIH